MSKKIRFTNEEINQMSSETESVKLIRNRMSTSIMMCTIPVLIAFFLRSRGWYETPVWIIMIFIMSAMVILIIGSLVFLAEFGRSRREIIQKIEDGEIVKNEIK